MKFSIIFTVFFLFLFFHKPILAADGDANQPAEETATTNLDSVIQSQGFFQTNVSTFISKGVQAIIAVGGLLCLVYLIWGAIDWLTSDGEAEKLKNARGKIINAVVGLAILVVSWALWNLVLYFLGLDKAISS